jgi:hypothetical protein
LEHDARKEKLQVQNKKSLTAEGYYADVGKNGSKMDKIEQSEKYVLNFYCNVHM